jgi:hypothetical protein
MARKKPLPLLENIEITDIAAEGQYKTYINYLRHLRLDI